MTLLVHVYFILIRLGSVFEVAEGCTISLKTNRLGYLSQKLKDVLSFYDPAGNMNSALENVPQSNV